MRTVQPSATRAQVHKFLDDLDPLAREIRRRYCHGARPTEICAALNMSRAEVRYVLRYYGGLDGEK
ncbi:MAG: hypothetical protein ABSH33_18630 [Steroidobacteraceae bacterium]|jgi:DNA-directed RNA polymerase specialized sigma24 family protein